MDTATLSSKGQLVIPRQVRDLAHLMAGDEFAVNYVQGEIRLRPLNRAKTTTIDDVAGCLAGLGGGKPVSEAKTRALILARLRAEDEATKTPAKAAAKPAARKAR